MKEIERLIFQILNLLDVIETKRNQPTINRIRGLIFEILEELNV